MSRSLLSALAALALAGCASRTNTDPPVLHPPQDLTGRVRKDWTNGAVVYELFVRSFADSNGDGIGDLNGLISKLDYLNDGKPETTTDLGVDALWLMPVFASPSYHGYDVTDYERINPDYGTNEDFERLCAEAHQRGIKIILDLVVNHSSSQHPWFLDSASGPSAAHRDWYVWSPNDQGWKQPWGGNNPTWHQKNGAWYYGVFWDGMPDLNFKTQAVRDEVKRLGALWLQRGADGFRLDAARYLIENGAAQAQADTVETHKFWQEFAAAMRAIRPDVALAGENWSDTSVIAKYFGQTDKVPGGDELPLNFDFPLAEQILKGVAAEEAGGIAAKLAEIQVAYPLGVTDAPFLTNHDQIRLATQLGNDQSKLRSAAAILLTVSGSPFLYYGEELGMLNGPGGQDEYKRTPFPWDASARGGFSTAAAWVDFAPGAASANVATQSGDPRSLLSRYRALIRARHASAALSRGQLELLTPAGSSSKVLAFVRTEGDEKVLVVHNLTGGLVSAGPYPLGESVAEPLFLDDGAALFGGATAWRPSLPAHGTGAWRLR